MSMPMPMPATRKMPQLALLQCRFGSAAAPLFNGAYDVVRFLVPGSEELAHVSRRVFNGSRHHFVIKYTEFAAKEHGSGKFLSEADVFTRFVDFNVRGAIAPLLVCAHEGREVVVAPLVQNNRPCGELKGTPAAAPALKAMAEHVFDKLFRARIVEGDWVIDPENTSEPENNVFCYRDAPFAARFDFDKALGLETGSDWFRSMASMIQDLFSMAANLLIDENARDDAIWSSWQQDGADAGCLGQVVAGLIRVEGDLKRFGEQSGELSASGACGEALLGVFRKMGALTPLQTLDDYEQLFTHLPRELEKQLQAELSLTVPPTA
jgi:hypothetical protein